MKKISKVLVLLLTLALICTGLVLAVSADEAKPETVSYVADGATVEGTLADAIAGADASTAVTLLGDCTVSEEIEVTKSVTINLNGYTLTTTCASAFNVSNGEAVFNITGTGNITSAGTLVKATADGAKIAIDGTGLDGITVNHTGTQSVNFITLKTNTLAITNATIHSLKGAQKGFFIANSGNSDITVKKTEINLDFNNVNGWNANAYYFANIGGTSHIAIEDSSIYTRNNLIYMHTANNGTNESVLIKNSTIRINDNDSAFQGQRLALVFAGGSNTANGVVNAYDSLLECSGRMFASEVDNTKITVNAYGVTLKITWSECDQIKNANSGNINRRFEAVNLYNSESGNYCKIISIDGNIAQTNGGGVTAQEPGVRVNIPSVTTSTAYTTGIKVPGGTFAASNTEDAYEWVYDPVGDPDAPYVLIDKTKTTVNVPTHYTNVGFDTIRFNKSSGKKTDNSLLTAGVENKDINDPESYASHMQIKTPSGATIFLASEVGNSYLKYSVVNSTLEDPYIITGKNSVTQSVIDRTSFAGHKVVVNEFDFSADSNLGFVGCDVILQSRAVSTEGKEVNLGGYKMFAIDKEGKIINNVLENGDKNAYTRLSLNEWYRASVVFYTEKNLAYVYINGVLMGSGKIYTDDAAFAAAKADSAYVQGVRFAFWKTNQIVGSSLGIDNISTRAYADYQNAETAANLSASAAYGYITTASPRKYVGKSLTVNGRPIASLEEAVDYAIATGSKIEVNKNMTLDNVKGNVVVDIADNNVIIGSNNCGFINDGSKYKFNEDYWYNAYYYTGDLGKISSGNYDINDFTSFGVVKLGYALNIPAFYTERTEDYVNYTVNTQNGWIYNKDQTDPVLPKTPDLSDLAFADKDKNVLYLPLLDTIPMTHIVKNANGEIVSYGISNDETHNAFVNLTDKTTLVLLSDFKVKSTPSGIRYKNDAPIVNADGVTTVNGVVIDNDYTKEEIAAMRQVAVDYKIDLNGYSMNLGNVRIHIGQNVEFSIYSSAPGAAVNMVYKNGTEMSGERTFNMALVNSNNWNETEADMLQNMNSRCNFGTYTDRDGNVVESEMFSMSGAVIFEAVSADSSCSYNINNVMASRVAPDSNGLIVSRYFAGKINVENSIITAIGTGASSYLVDVRQPTNPEIVFENCLLLHSEAGKLAVRGGGTAADNAKNVIYRNCISSAYLNTPGDKNHIYFGEGTASQYMQVDGLYDAEGLVEAYCYEPMTVGAFANGERFIKVHRPVYSSSKGDVNYNNYYYFVDHGYAEEFKAQYPGVSYVELPLLTTKIVKAEDTVKVTFNKLNGEAAKEVYYVKGADVTANIYNADCNALTNVTLADEDKIYNANAVALTATGWDALPTDVQADVVINPTYTVKANVAGLKANLSLYADFNINLYIPANYADYAAIYVGENLINTTSTTIGEAEYLAAAVSQKCNMAGDDVVFTIALAETINGKLCEAEASVTLSIIKYASAILAGNYTDADKVLMYYMLNYANEAERYIDNVSDEKVTNLLDTYAAYGEKYNVDYTYDEVCDTSALAQVFDTATLNIESTPAFLFAMNSGFVGNVTISYANGLVVKNFEVNENTDRNIALNGMKVYNFGTIITITAEGTVNGVAVSVSGNYSLDTFANYHAGNAVNEESETKALSEACMPLIKSLFAYAEVAELYKTNTLADALVVGE